MVMKIEDINKVNKLAEEISCIKSEIARLEQLSLRHDLQIEINSKQGGYYTISNGNIIQMVIDKTMEELTDNLDSLYKQLEEI